MTTCSNDAFDSFLLNDANLNGLFYFAVRWTNAHMQSEFEIGTSDRKAWNEWVGLIDHSRGTQDSD